MSARGRKRIDDELEYQFQYFIDQLYTIYLEASKEDHDYFWQQLEFVLGDEVKDAVADYVDENER